VHLRRSLAIVRGALGPLALTNVTDPNLGAGNNTVGLACNELNSDISYYGTNVSAVVLGPG
jgi:hypothetical protein